MYLPALHNKARLHKNSGSCTKKDRAVIGALYRPSSWDRLLALSSRLCLDTLGRRRFALPWP